MGKMVTFLFFERPCPMHLPRIFSCIYIICFRVKIVTAKQSNRSVCDDFQIQSDTKKEKKL